ncbi:hypothetical protein EC973_004481 [Apophysomyces ossiformis]|uniref:Uncharacterized protein n=1 Tax=Apophysomyces ossiformis TaxID=679940 RepID=A0A8H7BI88_9FUNG|nr:hypothetical protein EC973_004481 [Apophysomyces ossiformis]
MYITLRFVIEQKPIWQFTPDRNDLRVALLGRQEGHYVNVYVNQLPMLWHIVENNWNVDTVVVAKGRYTLTTKTNMYNRTNIRIFGSPMSMKKAEDELSDVFVPATVVNSTDPCPNDLRALIDLLLQKEVQWEDSETAERAKAWLEEPQSKKPRSE